MKILIAVSALAVLVTCIGAVAGRPVRSATTLTERHSEVFVPVEEMMGRAKNLPVESFSAF
jgi:hypothetical protein